MDDVCVQSDKPISKKEIFKYLYEAVLTVEKAEDKKYWFTLHIDNQREGD